MKKLLSLAILFVLFSCDSNEDQTTNDNLQTNLRGQFTPTDGISVTGEAKIKSAKNSSELNLDNFSISEGPDLKIYLSKTALPNDFISLGDLTDSKTYAIPENVDFSQYQYVLIHCEEFNHLYAIAKLSEL